MTSTLLSWNEFITEAKEFLKISERLEDNWSLNKKNDNEGNSFLTYQQKIQWREGTTARRAAPGDEIPTELTMEDDDLSTMSENVCDMLEDLPAKTEEVPISSVHAPEKAELAPTSPLDPSAKAEEVLQMEYHVVYSISYQVPVLLFRASKCDGRQLELEQAWSLFCSSPGLQQSFKLTRQDLLSTLTQMEHPVLHKPFLALHPCRTAELLEQAGPSRNRVLTFISIMGPFVRLELPNEYGLKFE